MAFSFDIELGIQTEMHRDSLLFPCDDDGDLLWAMRMAGDDLIVSRDVNFLVLFASEASAGSYAAEMQEGGFEVHVDECCDDTYDIPVWETVAAVCMVPSYERISAVGDLVARIATDHGGATNGWASMPV